MTQKTTLILTILGIVILMGGCAIKGPPPLWRVESALKYKNTKPAILQSILSPPARSSFDEEGNEVLEWDARVHRSRTTTTWERESERKRGVIPSARSSYYAYCTVKITFNPEGRKIAHEYIGAGCFNKEGKIYDSTSWWPDD